MESRPGSKPEVTLECWAEERAGLAVLAHAVCPSATAAAPIPTLRPQAARLGAADDEENPLLRRLLEELDLPLKLPDDFDHPMADLQAILAADYREAPGFPPNGLARELLRIVENRVKPYGHIWRCWQDRQSLHHLRRVFNWGDIVVNAQPYMQDTGLSLWGFSCEVKIRGRRKFVIFLNTAHDPGAVAATVGHELGHYIYNSIATGKGAEQAAMGSIFTEHLTHEQELFSDAVVALSAYSHPVIRGILGSPRAARCDSDSELVGQIRSAFDAIDPQYRIDLARGDLTAPWRIRYLTLMVHFFKLRCALLDAVGI